MRLIEGISITKQMWHGVGSLLFVLAFAAEGTAQMQHSDRSTHRLPFTVAAEVGLGAPVPRQECTNGGYASGGVRLATRGTLFATIGVLAIANPLGYSGCGYIGSARTQGDDVIISGLWGLQLVGAIANADIGFRSPRKLLIFRPELALRAGGVIGQEEFESTWMPSLGGVATLAAGRAYIDFEVMHIRTPQWEARIPAAEWNGVPDSRRPEGSLTRWNWNELRSVRIGFRL